MRLAVIPARGGSKRIPRKNIKPFDGLPMIAWPIKAALQSECFDRIIVSTDDTEIAQVSQNCGAEVPFLRPPELSDDFAGTVSVIAHAIKWQQANGVNPTEVCCIYPTSPFLEAKDLQFGLQVLLDSAADFAVSVTNYPYPIQRALEVTENGRVQMIQPKYLNVRTQDLADAWHDAATFYWGRPEAWLANESIFGLLAVPVKLPRYKVHDLDTQQDWDEAELLCGYIKQRERVENEISIRNCTNRT